ncbi:hypothetical protein M433DRAFT_64658, partial [Acidomyces richmondensis BFW]
DFWCRPGKIQATHPPFYLTQSDQVPYCYTCGQVLGARRRHSSEANSTREVKYCSDKCKRREPSSTSMSGDGRIEATLVALLERRTVSVNGDEEAAKTTRFKTKKGDPGIIVKLSQIEMAVFGGPSNPEKVYGRKKNRWPRFMPKGGKSMSLNVDEERPAPVFADRGDTAMADHRLSDNINDSDDGAGVPHHTRSRLSFSRVNLPIRGECGWAAKIEKTPEMLAKRREGQRRADEREHVRNAARQAIAFEIWTHCPPLGWRRMCEALMNGRVVESSFTKGDWEIRLKEE